MPGLAFAKVMTSFSVFAANEGCAANRFGNFDNCVTGVKSRTGSYGSLVYSDGLMVSDEATTSKVCPSGAALVTISVPLMVPAPGRLSTITVCLKISVSRAAINRAVRSVDAPGDCGTTMRIGRDGYAVASVCANTGAQHTAIPSTAICQQATMMNLS